MTPQLSMTPQLAPPEGSRSVLSGGQGSRVEGGTLGSQPLLPCVPTAPHKWALPQVRGMSLAPVGALCNFPCDSNVQPIGSLL